MVAQGVAISPSLLYISESGSAGIAIGANVVRQIAACLYSSVHLGIA